MVPRQVSPTDQPEASMLEYVMSSAGWLRAVMRTMDMQQVLSARLESASRGTECTRTSGRGGNYKKPSPNTIIRYTRSCIGRLSFHRTGIGRANMLCSVALFLREVGWQVSIRQVCSYRPWYEELRLFSRTCCVEIPLRQCWYAD